MAKPIVYPLDGTDPLGNPQSLYVQEPGNAAAVSMYDIHQNAFGDCFLLASMAEIARQSVIMGNTGLIPSMIYDNGDGSQWVKLYQPDPMTYGFVPGMGGAGYTPTYQLVGDFFMGGSVNSGSTQSFAHGHKEIWPQVIEQAYAQQNGFDAVANGGQAFLAMEELTGKPAMNWDPSLVTASQLISMTNEHDLIVFETLADGPLQNGLVNNHAYAFAGYNNFGKANMTINLQNPWGTDNPAPVAVSQFAGSFADIAVGHFM